MKLLNIDLASNLTAIPDTTHVDPIKEVVEKYAGMTADEIISTLLSHALSFGLKFVGALLIFFIGRWLMNRFSRFVVHLLARRHVEPSVQSFYGVYQYNAHVVLIVLIIGIFGINTTSFVALFAIL